MYFSVRQTRIARTNMTLPVAVKQLVLQASALRIRYAKVIKLLVTIVIGISNASPISAKIISATNRAKEIRKTS